VKYIKIGGAFQIYENFEFQTIIKGYPFEAELYSMDEDGLLKVKKYYTWDGPSGALNTKDFVKGSGIHDIGCEVIDAGLMPRETQCLWDEQMIICNTNQGMWLPRRVWTYMAVRLHMLGKKRVAKPKVYEVK